MAVGNEYKRRYEMTTRYQDDFYQAVNGDWIEKATIPADRPVTGVFYYLVELI